MIRTFPRCWTKCITRLGHQPLARRGGCRPQCSRVPETVPAAVLIAPPTDPRPFLRLGARGLGAPDTLLDDVQREAEAPRRRCRWPSGGRRSVRTSTNHSLRGRARHQGRRGADHERPRLCPGPYARLLVTDGLGHRRVLRTCTRRRRRALHRGAPAAPAADPREPSGVPSHAREHRDMLTDVGANGVTRAPPAKAHAVPPATKRGNCRVSSGAPCVRPAHQARALSLADRLRRWLRRRWFWPTSLTAPRPACSPRCGCRSPRGETLVVPSLAHW